MPNAVFLRFLLLFPDIPTNGDFLLRDLPGSGNRIDVLCRCLSACFGWGPTSLTSEEIEARAILSDEITLQFHPPNNANEMGETDWAHDIRDCLEGEPPDYISILEKGFEDNLQELLNNSSSCVWVLEKESKTTIESWKPSPENSFILGDHKGFDSCSLKLLREYDIPDLSLGPLPYLGSHCIAAVIAELERRKEHV